MTQIVGSRMVGAKNLEETGFAQAPNGELGAVISKLLCSKRLVSLVVLVLVLVLVYRGFGAGLAALAPMVTPVNFTSTVAITSVMPRANLSSKLQNDDNATLALSMKFRGSTNEG